ncbi:MAG: hypothetical protein Fur0018_11960 [Anaerolineales bacterium]
MKFLRAFPLWLIFVLITLVMLLSGMPAQAQQPTPGMPTVTGTPSVPIGRTVTDNDTIRVRAEPRTDSTQIGFLLPGQDVPVLGRSPGGDWLKVVYPGVPGNAGWVFSPLIILPPSAVLPIVEPPPVTPQATPTINPTLAAQFIRDIPPTRMPTFTPPPPLAIPTFTVEKAAPVAGGVPMGLVIITLGVIGFFGLLISFVSNR